MKTLARDDNTAEILERLRDLRPDSARKWGRMSVHQMVCHLKDCCLMATGEKQVRDASKPIQRTVIKWIALYSPLPWPRGIQTRPEVDQEGSGSCPVDFSSDVADVESLLRAIAGSRTRNEWPVHPIFGRMSRKAWLRWAYLHTDHHLRQFGA
jgi:Protein of unknown function (DUF1569)